MTKLIAVAANGSHTPFLLGDLLHAGGAAGRIHRIANNPAAVVKLYHSKVYHDPNMKIALRLKIEAMISRVPDLKEIKDHRGSFVQIAWPTAVVVNKSGQMIGFQMPLIDSTKAVLLENLLQRTERRRHKLPEQYHLRVFAALNLASIFTELHRLNHHMIDMKPVNLFVYRESMYVAVIDCDGFSILATNGRRFPANHITPEYTAWEAQDKRPQELGEEQDCFALAVLIFQLLNNGIHPFQGIPEAGAGVPSPLSERIRARVYTYGRQPSPRQNPTLGSIHSYFEDTTRNLFDRAFTTIDQRPRAEEWRDHLRYLIKNNVLVRCTKVPAEHTHFSKGC